MTEEKKTGVKQMGESIEAMLLSLPGEISKQEEEVIKASDEIAEIEKKTDWTRTETLAKVASEMGMDNKPVFSNDLKRTAETEKRLRLNEEFQKQLGEITEKKRSKAAAEVKLRELNNMFRARIAIMKGRREE